MEARGRGRAQRGGRSRGGDQSQQSQRPGANGQNRDGQNRDGQNRGGQQGAQYRGGQGGQYRGGQQGGGQQGGQGGQYRGGQQGGQYRGGQQGGGQQGGQGGQYRGGQQGGQYRGGQQGGGQQGGQHRGGQGDGQQGAWGRSQPGQRPPQQQPSQWPQPQGQQQQGGSRQAATWGNKPPLRWDQQQGQAPPQQGQAPPQQQHQAQPQPQPAPQQQPLKVAEAGSKDFPKPGGRGGGGEEEMMTSEGNEAAGTSLRGAGRERGGGNGAVRGRLNRSEILWTRPKAMENSKQGTSGNPISLTANFFELIEHADWHLVQYEVKYAPEIDDTRLKKKMMNQAFKDEPASAAYIFDGSSLFTPIKIHSDPLEKHVQDDAFGLVRITIKQSGVLAWGDWSYIQVFNIIIRKCLQLMQFELIQRNYYDANAMEDIPNHPLRVWPGYFTSIRQYEKKIMINVDLCFKVMRKDNCYDLLLTCMDNYNRWNLADYKRKLAGNIVLTYYNNKTYRVDDIENSMNPLSTFKKKDGSEVTYKQYYYERYKIQIQVDNQPLLVSKSRARERRAGAPELILLVPELCQLTGLSDEQRANFHLMSAMATKTRIPPAPRQQKLIQFARRLISNQDAMKEIKKWDLKLADNLVKVQGRVLPNEYIKVSRDIQTVTSHKADWMNSCKSGMLDLAKFDQMIVLHPNSKETQNFISAICKAGGGMGWRMPRFTLENVGRGGVGDYLHAIDNVQISKNQMTLIICVVPNKNAERYHAIKKRCCVDRGIPSQVVLEKQFRARGVMSIASKIAIQMNCKLGGTPWSIGVPLDDIMVVGYDVCRDTLNKGKSFGAMVASVNRTLSRYYSSVTEHLYSEEISKNFANFMCTACERYRQINGRLPGRILIYRDGVGDGQIPYVFENEVVAIKSQLKAKLYPEENALKICTIIVTKRINTRVFHGENNPPPGTVIDNTITMPQKFDFFLVPQCVNQGTVTPTGFNCIDFTEFGLSPDRLQILTYKMCHLYFNWSGTIRVPAPCQYAHKLAFLTAQSLHRPAHPCLDTLLFFL